MNPFEATDLVCRARQKSLGEAEQRRLEGLLATSFEVRLMDAVLTELERESQVKRSDQALMARLAARAVSQRRSLVVRGGLRGLLRPALVALTLLSVATVAAAGFWYRTTRSPVQDEPQSSSALVFEVLPAASLPIPSPSSKESPATDSNELHQSVDSKTPPRALTPRPETTRGEAALFARANQARREGRPAEARALYAEFLVSYPKAREASLARLAYAKLAAHDAPDQALRESSIVAEARGPLRAEALWGIAVLARRLGRTSLEQRALTELRRDYPASPYAQVAEERLEHLGP